MTPFATKAGDERDYVMRWIEEGHKALEVLLNTFTDYGRLQGVAESAAQECERLGGENERLRAQLEAAQLECERLRQDAHRLRTETERYSSEREELAESLNKFLNEVLLKLRLQQT